MNHIYPAVKAIIQQDEKFLIIKYEFSNKTVWDLPGGKINYGESPYDTLIREVKEEINLSIKIRKIFGLFWFFRKKDKDQVICTTFLCTTNNYEIDLTKNPTNENITEYRWVTKEEFFSNDYEVGHDSMKKLLALL